MVSVAKRAIKAVLFPGTRPRKILFGAGKGVILCGDPSHNGQRYLGLAELEIAREFVRFAEQSKSFCDVGASDGWYCLVARKHNPGLQVVAVEPHPRPDTRMNLELNDVYEGPAFRWIYEHCSSTGKSLDDVLIGLNEPIFLKIDIDGGEFDALSSGVRTLREKVCLLIVETHSQELEQKCIELLQGIGYRVKVIPTGWYRIVIREQRPIPHNRWFTAVRT